MAEAVSGRRSSRLPADWVRPWWLDQQLDASRAVSVVAPPGTQNRTARNWTTLGVPDRPERWVVDRRGLVSPAGAAWGLDWMVGAAERWYVPAGAVAVRQHRVASAPVIETVVSLRSGDVVHRCWAELVADRAVAWVEVRNDGLETVALAVGLRPYSPERLGRLVAVEVTERSMCAEGVTVLQASAPARHGVARGDGEDAAAVVLAGGADGPPGCGADSPEGLATAFSIWGLGGHETLRFALGPIGVTVGAGVPLSAPSAGPDRVAAGWAARAGSAARMELPEGRLSEAVLAVHRRLPLVAPDSDVPRFRAATRVLALVSAGWVDEAGSVVEAWLATPGRGGRMGGDAADTAVSLIAVASWARSAGRVLDPGSLGSVARAAEHVVRRSRRLEPAGCGRPLMAAGLAAAATLLSAGGEMGAAGQVEAWRAGLSADAGPLAAPLPASEHPPPVVSPSGSARSHAGAGAGEGVGAGAGEGRACLDAVGEALGALDGGRDPSVPLRWLLDVATPTWTWPGVADPRTGTGVGGDGDDPDVAAGMWRIARELLVGDAPGLGMPPGKSRARIALLRWLPPEWAGEALEVHGLPTGAGRVGFALRWHGRRPALLWAVSGDGPELSVTAPGLDPAWEGEGRSGEALLAELQDPAGDRRASRARSSDTGS